MSAARRALRVVTLNLWNDQGPAEARLRHCERQLRALQPDVLLLQEVRSGPGCDQAARLASALSAEVVFDAVDPDSRGGPIGNAVLTRLPVLERASQALPSPPGDPRRVLAVTLDSGHGRIVAASCHLTWQLDAEHEREREVVAADRFVRALASDLPRILGGDFNCAPDSDVIRFMTGRCSLEHHSTYWRDAFARRHPHDDGWTWARRNSYVVRHIEPDRRIDYLFVGIPHQDGTGQVMDARVALDVPDEEGVFASDHFAVVADVALGS